MDVTKAMEAYKKRKHPLLSRLIVLVMLVGGLGGIISRVWLVPGIILTALGVIGTLWRYLGSKAQERKSESLFDAQAALLAKKGIGNIYTEAGDLELNKGWFTKEAIERYQKALEIDPNDLQALRMLCIVFSLELGKCQRIGLERRPEFAEMLATAKSYAARGKKVAPEDYSFYDTLGILYDIEGKHEEAREEFRKSGNLRTDPFWHCLMSTSWGMSGKLEEALREARLAIESVVNGHSALYYGRALNSVREYEQALPWLKRVLKENRFDPHTLVALREAYFFLGKYWQAARYETRNGFGMVLSGYSFSSGLRHLGSAFRLYLTHRISRLSKGIWPLTRRHRLLRKVHLRFFSPDLPEKSLGPALLERGPYTRLAERHLRVACTIVPDSPENLCNLASCLAMKGDRAEAIRMCDRAIEFAREPMLTQLKEYRVHLGKDDFSKPNIVVCR